MNRAIALIVDDEADIRELLEITLNRMGIEVHAARDYGQARDLLDRHRFDLCLTDMRLPDGDGIDLVAHIAAHHPNLPVAMITAHGSMESAIQALKAGAFDFVSKPVDLRDLRKLVETALKLRKTPSREDAPSAPPGEVLFGDSPAMEKIRRMIGKLARSQAPVYVSGESGTGKELAARLIHSQGPRADRPFIAVNCGAIPQELMESEFFGHRKGSFTGAVEDKEGLFQAADGGTLFLDEVADLPLPMQVKLLRAIQEKRIRSIGAAVEVPIDVRIISATHKDLETLVAEDRFRQDLFYRINVIQLPMPPLRERRQDIPLLAERILDTLAEGSGPRARLADSALEQLCGYPFPGNVRELENILERATTLCEENLIDGKDLQLPAASVTGGETAAAVSNLEDYLSDMERQALIQALEKTRWNRTAAAKQLGISFRALRYRLEKLGLNEEK